MSYSFFGIQTAVRVQPGDPLLREFRDRMGVIAPRSSPIELRGFYQPATQLLSQAVSRSEFGYWDFIPDAPNGENTFDEWVSEIEGSLRSADDFVPTVREASGESGFALATMIFLLLHGSNSHHTAAERCDIREESFFLRSTFRMLFETVPMFTFTSVKASALYVAPATGDRSVSLAEIRGEGYEYLRPLSGE